MPGLSTRHVRCFKPTAGTGTRTGNDAVIIRMRELTAELTVALAVGLLSMLTIEVKNGASYLAHSSDV